MMSAIKYAMSFSRLAYIEENELLLCMFSFAPDEQLFVMYHFVEVFDVTCQKGDFFFLDVVISAWVKREKPKRFSLRGINRGPV